jgi:hypothetical protein
MKIDHDGGVTLTAEEMAADFAELEAAGLAKRTGEFRPDRRAGLCRSMCSPTLASAWLASSRPAKRGRDEDYRQCG